MNCTAMIEEKDAAKFLYRYNNTPLETVIDTDIKKLVEDRFNIETTKYPSTELGAKKGEIMEAVKNYVIPYFKEYGITITVLGMKEGVSYENDKIQKAIDEKFASEQELVIQQNKNEAAIAKAEAEAKAKIMDAEAQAKANALLSESLTPELLEKMYYEKWDGKLPTIYGSDATSIVQLP
jgi:regulator of protease activity HflC (stomatin/prohibitin superfamily)